MTRGIVVGAVAVVLAAAGCGTVRQSADPPAATTTLGSTTSTATSLPPPTTTTVRSTTTTAPATTTTVAPPPTTTLPEIPFSDLSHLPCPAGTIEAGANPAADYCYPPRYLPGGDLAHPDPDTACPAGSHRTMGPVLCVAADDSGIVAPVPPADAG